VAATHLADTSALLELQQPQLALRLGGLVVAGLVATCGVVDLELLARFDAEDRADVLAERRFFQRVPCGDDVLDRAMVVQGLVGDPPPATVHLVVAAAAELAGLVLLHDDDTFDRIAATTGQPIERVR
jgi:predicted nucleic acid-binding protein